MDWSGVVVNRVDAQIDEIVATCDGNLVSAVRALLLVNERLELEIAQLRATQLCALPTPLDRSLRGLTTSSETRYAAPAP
jgi:hypothetical protein